MEGSRFDWTARFFVRNRLPRSKGSIVDYGDLITEHALSLELSVSAWTLRAWRRKRYGPPAIKLGKRVMYRRTDLRSFLAQLD